MCETGSAHSQRSPRVATVKRYRRAERAPQEVAVRELDRTRRRGRARGVDDRRDGIEVVLVSRGTCVTRSCGPTPRGLALQSVLHDQRRAVTDERALGLPQAQVDGHGHGSEQQAGVECLDELGSRR